jgi:hypothetical protein
MPRNGKSPSTQLEEAMTPDNDHDRSQSLQASQRLGWPRTDVPLAFLVDLLEWPQHVVVDFAWDGTGLYWDTDAGLGFAPTVLEAP